MPAVSTERIHLFLAPYRASDRTGPGGGLAHEGEDITVEVLPLDALADMVDEGALGDMKTALLVHALRHRRPHLFARPSTAEPGDPDDRRLHRRSVPRGDAIRAQPPRSCP